MASGVLTSQWDKIFQSREIFEQVWNFYQSQKFPINIRIRLDPYWLEFCVCEIKKTANPDDVSVYDNFMRDFFHKLQDSANQLYSLALGNNDALGIGTALDLLTETDDLNRKFQNNSVGLFRILEMCLDYESECIMQRQGGFSPSSLPFSPDNNEAKRTDNPQTVISRYNELEKRIRQVVAGTSGITQMWKINEGREHIQACIIDLAQLLEDSENLKFDIQVESSLQSNGTVSARLPQLQQKLTFTQNRFTEQIGNLKMLTIDFSSDVKNALDTFHECLEILQGFIKEWKLEQRRAANGIPVSHNLEWIASLARMLTGGLVDLNTKILCYSRIQNCLTMNGEIDDGAKVSQLFNDFKLQLDQLIHRIVTATFVVEVEPPQIIRLRAAVKKDIKVQLLVGSALMRNNSPVVTAILIGKDEAEKLHNNPLYIPKPSIRIKNNEMEMSFEESTSKFGANLSGIMLPENRGEKGKPKQKDSDDSSVPTTKYCFYFKMTFEAPDIAPFTVWTTSLPVIVTCHPVQDANASATILWDNSFSLPERKSFDVPKEVDPKELIQALSSVFKLQTGRELSASHQSFLLRKLLRGGKGPVTWQMFFEDRVDCNHSKTLSAEEKKKPEKITFNKWLYEIKKLCESSTKDDHDIKKSKQQECKKSKETTSIPNFWSGRLIEGFIDKSALEEKLRSSQQGTFILYFSEAILGALTIAWYNHQRGMVEKFAPYEVKDLQQQSLEERILSEHHLRFLYPDIPKEKVFTRLRDTRELSEFKYEMIKRGYIWHSQKQVTAESSSGNRTRQTSTSSISTSVQGKSPYSFGSSPYGSPHSVSSNNSSYHINSPPPYYNLTSDSSCSNNDQGMEYSRRPTTPEVIQMLADF